MAFSVPTRVMGFISPMAFKLEPVGSPTKIAGVCCSSCMLKPHGGGECLAPDDDKQFARLVNFVVTEQRMQQVHIQIAVAAVVTTRVPS